MSRKPKVTSEGNDTSLPASVLAEIAAGRAALEKYAKDREPSAPKPEPKPKKAKAEKVAEPVVTEPVVEPVDPDPVDPDPAE